MIQKEGLTKAQLARKLGISRIRVTQLLNLLKLPQERQDYVLLHGKDEMLTERKLRRAISV